MQRVSHGAELGRVCHAFEKELTALRDQSVALSLSGKEKDTETNRRNTSECVSLYARLHRRILSYIGAPSDARCDMATCAEREADELDREVQKLESMLRDMQSGNTVTQEATTPPRRVVTSSGGGGGSAAGLQSCTVARTPCVVSPSCTTPLIPRVDNTARTPHSSLSLSPTSSSSALLPTLSRHPFVAFASQLAELRAHLTTAQLTFQSILARSVEELRDGRVSASDVRLADPALWRVKEQLLQRVLTEVRNKAGALQARISSHEHDPTGEAVDAIDGAELDPVAHAADRLAEVQGLAAAAADHLRRGVELRQRRDAQLRVFVEECARLTMWCRQQHANLDAMQSADHLQEYCATLVENYPAMSDNISFLLTTVQPFVESDNATVRKAMSELSELWFYLQVTAMERLARTLYEVHSHSLLETECERYAGFGSEVWSYVCDMQALLDDVYEQRRKGGQVTSRSRRACRVPDQSSVAPQDSPHDAGSSDKERVNENAVGRANRDNDTETQGNRDSAADNDVNDLQARRAEGAMLLQGMSLCGPEELHGAMRLFAQRVRVVRAGYQCLRDAALTRLTFLASTADIVARSKQRQVEFEDCITRLRKWAKVAAHGESWRDIYTKIVDIKRLIKQEQGELTQRDERSHTTNM